MEMIVFVYPKHHNINQFFCTLAGSMCPVCAGVRCEGGVFVCLLTNQSAVNQNCIWLKYKPMFAIQWMGGCVYVWMSVSVSLSVFWSPHTFAFSFCFRWPLISLVGSFLALGWIIRWMHKAIIQSNVCANREKSMCGKTAESNKKERSGGKNVIANFTILEIIRSQIWTQRLLFSHIRW